MDGARQRNRGAGHENRQHQRQRDKFLHIIKPFSDKAYSASNGSMWRLASRCAVRQMGCCTAIITYVVGVICRRFATIDFANRAALIRPTALHPRETRPYRRSARLALFVVSSLSDPLQQSDNVAGEFPRSFVCFVHVVRRRWFHNGSNNEATTSECIEVRCQWTMNVSADQ